jgi:uncharacterized protein YcnI
MKRLVPLLLIGALLPSVAHAHAVVEPARSAPRAYQRYVLRVPNEFDDVATTRVEIRFPAEARVISFADVTGWQLEVVRDSANRVTRAVWTGSLPPGRFVEFLFMAVNPESGTRLAWPVVQTYASGERVEWEGPPDSDRPASTTEIGSSPDGPSRLLLVIAVGAAVLAPLSLGIALARRRQR